MLVTKLEAARRQLDAAILMYFREDDELAVHSVANAALGIMQELVKKRGRDVFTDQIKLGIFEMLKAYRKGTLDSRISDEPGFKEFVVQIPDTMWRFIEEDNLEGARIRMAPIEAEKYWREFKKSYNFLKHGDRDPAGTLALEEVDNLQVLQYASSAYVQLGLAPTDEMLTFVAYCASLEPFDIPPAEPLKKMVEALRKYEGAKRKLRCRFMIGDRLRSVMDETEDE